MGWIKANEIYTSDDASPIVLFTGDTTSGPLYRTPRVWHTMDLKPLGVTADATYADLSAHMIITDLTTDIEQLTCTVRRPGSTLAAGNYQFQEVSVAYGDGRRGRQGGVCVPLVNGCFELYWDWTSAGVPDTSASTALINMALQSWGRYQPPESTPAPPSVPMQEIIVPPGGLPLMFVQGA